MVAHIRRNCGAQAVSEDDERLIGLYALVHDITHMPFGHTIEDERRLYKKAYLVSRRSLTSTEKFAVYHLNPAERAAAEKWLARKLRVPFRSVIVYCPSAAMQLREANALFKLAAGEPPRRLSNNEEIENLKRRQERLWKFIVFLDPEHSDKLVEAGRLCEEYFGQPNELPAMAEAPSNGCGEQSPSAV